MAHVGRRQLVLMLLGIGDEERAAQGIGGITRLQKLLFLLQQEEGLEPHGDGFSFTPYKAGPYSPALYDDLQFLENLGLIDAEVSAEATEEEAIELDQLNFEDLLCESEETDVDQPEAADAYEEHQFILTREGKEKVEELLASGAYAPVVAGIRRIKSKYSKYSLQDLLYYVYTRYPSMTTESEIKDRILSRRRRR